MTGNKTKTMKDLMRQRRVDNIKQEREAGRKRIREIEEQHRNRAGKQRKNIYIHPDHVEDLDERRRQQEANKKEPSKTGYSTVCRLINRDNCRELLLKGSFVRSKCKSGAVFIFKVCGKDQVMMQPVPIEFMNRTAIMHVHKRSMSAFRRYGYHAVMDGTPQPCQVLHMLGLSPVVEEYVFRLDEYVVQDEAFGETFAYRFIPLHIG